MANSTKIIYVTILLLLLSLSMSAQSGYTEEEVIPYSKALVISRLDERLSSEPLADWLRFGPPRLDHVSWQTSPNCDQKPVASDITYSELPLCVKVSYTRGLVRGWLMVVVGTIGKGPSGQPHLKDGWVETGEMQNQAVKDTYFSCATSKLSELPLLLDEVSYSVKHKDVFDYTKAVDVTTLDPSLTSQRLDDWFHFGPAHAKRLEWGVSFDCGLRSQQSAAPGKESALCVTVVFGQVDIRGWVTILVGTFAKGPSGRPQIKSISVQPMSRGDEARRTSDKLSDLARLLEQVSSASDTQTGDKR